MFLDGLYRIERGGIFWKLNKLEDKSTDNVFGFRSKKSLLFSNDHMSEILSLGTHPR